MQKNNHQKTIWWLGGGGGGVQKAKLLRMTRNIFSVKKFSVHTKSTGEIWAYAVRRISRSALRAVRLKTKYSSHYP